MISNQILQTTIEGVKDISRVDFCVADTDAKVVASTFQVGMEFNNAILFHSFLLFKFFIFKIILRRGTPLPGYVEILRII